MIINIIQNDFFRIKEKQFVVWSYLTILFAYILSSECSVTSKILK